MLCQYDAQKGKIQHLLKSHCIIVGPKLPSGEIIYINFHFCDCTPLIMSAFVYINDIMTEIEHLERSKRQFARQLKAAYIRITIVFLE